MNVLMILISVLLAGLTAAVIYLMCAQNKPQKHIRTYEEELRKMQIALEQSGAEDIRIINDVLHFVYADAVFDFQFEYGLTEYPLRARLIYSLSETELFENISESGRALVANLVEYEYPTLSVCAELANDENDNLVRNIYFAYWFSYNDVQQALEPLGEAIGTIAEAVNMTVDLFHDEDFADTFSIENDAEDDEGFGNMQSRREKKRRPIGYRYLVNCQA